MAGQLGAQSGDRLLLFEGGRVVDRQREIVCAVYLVDPEPADPLVLWRVDRRLPVAIEEEYLRGQGHGDCGRIDDCHFDVLGICWVGRAELREAVCSEKEVRGRDMVRKAVVSYAPTLDRDAEHTVREARRQRTRK